MRLSAGNENERRHLVPLLDQLARRGRTPAQLLADRGYHSWSLIQSICERGIEPRISKPRRKGDPIPEGTKTWVVARGKGKQIKTLDPKAAERWPVERTNSWYRSCPRLDVRRDVKHENYLAFYQIRSIVLLAKRAF